MFFCYIQTFSWTGKNFNASLSNSQAPFKTVLKFKQNICLILITPFHILWSCNTTGYQIEWSAIDLKPSGWIHEGWWQCQKGYSGNLFLGSGLQVFRKMAEENLPPQFNGFFPFFLLLLSTNRPCNHLLVGLVEG